MTAIAASISTSSAHATSKLQTGYESRFGWSELYVLGSVKGDRIRVGYSEEDQAVLVADASGVRALDDGCEVVSKTRAECFSRPSSLVVEVASISGSDHVTFGRQLDAVYASVEGGDGDDTLVSTTRKATPQLDGEAGDDLIRGGEGIDYLYGGTGRDVLLAGGGDDLLYGDQGSDVLVGGDGIDALSGDEGPDVLRTADGYIEEKIDCGTGRDLAAVDSIDPRPIGCERRRRG